MMIRANSCLMPSSTITVKFIRACSSVLLLACLVFLAACAGAGIKWQKLSKESDDLYRKGNYERAVELGKRALEVAEKNFGPDHPDVATSLNNLALLYVAQGQYAEAEPLYKRSLAILEKALGPDVPC